jgi:hypothetical protein
MHPKPRNFGLYVAAHYRAYSWARKALAYRNAGKPLQAEAAADRAHAWLRRIDAMEAADILH